MTIQTTMAIQKTMLAVRCILTMFLLMMGNSYAVAESDKSGFALGVGAGTTGISLDATFRLSEHWNLRGVYAYADFSSDEVESGISYNFNFELDTFSLLLDWHPVASSGFRVSAGGVYNGTNFSARSTQTTGNITVGNNTFAASDIGQLNVEVDYQSFAPYLGIGWGNTINKSVTFSFDLGVIFMDNPRVNISSTGTNAAIQSSLDTQIEVERGELEAELDDFDAYPVAKFTLNYQF